MNGKKYFLNVIILVLLGWPQAAHPSTAPKERETWITVFVHGIMSIKPHVSLGNIFKFIHDDVENTIYSRTVELMRLDPHFYKNQAMQGFGLIKIDRTEAKGNGSGATAMVFDEITKVSSDKQLDNHYYTYGWSGLLSTSRRYSDAIGLYKGLEEEVKKFRRQGIEPKVRVIGYSHGGNVILNLGAVRQKESVTQDLSVNEVILIGMPVQTETDYLINDPLFKKIYHIFSPGDHVQKLDIFSLNRLLSERKFKGRKNFKLPKKLVQIHLKVFRPTEKTRNNKNKFEFSRDYDLPSVRSGHSNLLRDASSGHTELWFFSWTPLNYREYYPLSPLPTIVFAPYIIHALEPYNEDLRPKRPIIVDLRPEQGSILLKSSKNPKINKTIDFIPQKTFEYLQKQVLHYKPDNYTEQAYNKHISVAKQQAKDEYGKLWSKEPKDIGRRKRQKKKEKQLALLETMQQTLPKIKPELTAQRKFPEQN